MAPNPQITTGLEERSLRGGTGEKEISKRVNPVYAKYRVRYGFWRDSYEGGRDYTSKYLQTHRLESDGDYSKRVERSYFLNYTRNIVDIWTNAIFRAGVVRINATPEGKRFLQDVTGKGVRPNSFWKRSSTYSSIQGRTYILIDSPSLDRDRAPSIHTGVLDQQLRPYLKLLAAESFVDWSVDDLGNFNWALVKLSQTEDKNPLVARETQTVYLLLEPGKWSLFDSENKFIRGGTTRLDVVPIVTVHHVDFDENEIGESMITDISELNRAIFNWTSLLDEILYMQTFGQLVMQANEDEVKNEIMSTKRIFTYPKDSTIPPQYISPDASQANIFIQWIGKSVKEMFRLGFARKSGIDDPEQYNTATGKVLDLFDLQQALANKAAALQEADTKVAEIIGKYYGKRERAYDPIYPTQFDLRTLEGEIEDYAGLKLLDFGTEFNFEMAKRVVSKALPYLGEAKKEEMFGFVKAWMEKQAQAPEFTTPANESEEETETKQTVKEKEKVG